MPHPPSSYLSPAALEGALQFARELRDAGEDVQTMSSGARAGGGGGGRAGDAATVMRQWIGPHRDTFEELMAAEMRSAQLTRTRLDEEADAWAQFWAEATNARQQRLYEEELADHRRAVEHFNTANAAYQDAIEEDPSSVVFLSAPRRPIGPTPPVPVTVPTAAGDYRPTG